MKVLKFGGSSVGDASRIKQVINIVEEAQLKDKVAVVFSAFQGVTDSLIKMMNLAAAGDEGYYDIFQQLWKKHLLIAKDLIQNEGQQETVIRIKSKFKKLEDVLHGIFLIKELSPRTSDFVMSFGERLSVLIIANAIAERGLMCEPVDSRELIKTDDNFGSARVNFELTSKNIRDYFNEHDRLQIITGFIGSTGKGETTTLGRGGSDYTASIFGAALDAEEIQIWTDVDGVLTADPRKVKKAFPLLSITYEEAMELSHFGAKVIHPPTMHPALKKNIPLRIKNTFNPSFPGTLVSSLNEKNGYPVKGISSIDNISLLRIQGSVFVGVPGYAQRIFGALGRKEISIILITQASSEHSLCLAVMPSSAGMAKQLIDEEFKYEIREGLINEVIVETGLSIIAVVGENMRSTHGISGRVFQALGRNGINIAAIAQGSSELNISTVIVKEDEAKALNALHDAFFLSNEKTINVFLTGTGLIGSTLLEQILNQTEYLKTHNAVNINVIGLANSRKMYFDKNGVPLENWRGLLDESSKKTDLEQFIKEMKELNLPNSVFADCTASEEVAYKYTEVLGANISVVTANKKANSASYEYYKELRRTAQKHNVQFLYETNVGAGLPIIGTMKDLLSSGDKVTKIEGVFSGTLSYIFNTFTNGKAFSEIIFEAKEMGYTEPDPRDDLNGMDVARKLLILARETGAGIELSDIKVENLVPQEAREAVTIGEFFDKLKTHDESFSVRKKAAENKGEVLRYIACWENGSAEINLCQVGKDHPFYSMSGSDNIIALTTKNYSDRPIVIKGPGAGADVTAAGVFADILRIANYLS